LEDANALVPFGFVRSREPRPGEWDRIRVFYGNFLVRSGDTWLVRGSVALTGGLEDARLELLLGYVSSDDLVENHREVVKQLERTNAHLVQEICEQWREQILKPTLEKLAETLRTQPGQEPDVSLYRWYLLLWEVVGGKAAPGMGSGPEPI